MSADEEELVGQIDVNMVSDVVQEPSYITEIARKLRELNLPLGYNEGELQDVEVIRDTWGDLSETAATFRVMIIMSLIDPENNDSYEVHNYQYDAVEDSQIGDSQSVGSVHLSATEDGFEETREWKPYTVVHNISTSDVAIGKVLDAEGYFELGERLRRNVDTTVTPEDKLEIIDTLSSMGNEVSRHAESIMQDVMQRQFRYYDEITLQDYNDPGVDFAVKDTDRRNYGLVIEVSVRWVNPIGMPYVRSKLNTILDLEEEDIEDTPWDVIIMAPRFTQNALERYEDPEDPDWHSSPDEGMVHLHRVPTANPDVYHPFATTPDEIRDEELRTGGNPVIVPDTPRMRELIQNSGHISSNYPIVDSDYPDFRQYLSGVNREFVVVSESRYRNMLREQLEPLLWEFLRPYKIEQFLIDMYWDQELNQADIGRLISRSGSTIGTWMREWGVMRRGTGAPELSDETREVWRRMYEGEYPFEQQFSGYRIQAEYNRHPLWGLDDWETWYQDRTFAQRKETVAKQDSFRESLDYTVMVGASDRLQPSYTFILSTLRDMGVEIRAPDEAPRVPYNAYPDRKALEYMINKNENTIVDVSEEE